MSKPWVAFFILVSLYLTWTFDHSLWNPDETRDAGIAAEMFRGGDYVVPKLNGEAFLEKPPLYYWTSALIYKLTGQVTAGTTRLPSVLYGILGVVFTFLIGNFLFNQRVGLLSAALLALSAQYFRMSHFALMDVALAALVTGAFFFHLKGSKLGFILMTMLAFYAKGFLGVVLTGIVVVLHLVSEKRMKELGMTVALGILVFTALVLPWFYGLWKEGGAHYLEIFLIDNHWHRFFTETGDHTEHFWFFYFLSFPVDFLPGTFFFLGHVRHFLKNLQKYLDSKQLRFLLIWFWGLLLFFTVSSSKRSIYLLPLFPAASLLSGAWLSEVISRNEKRERIEKWFYRVFILMAIALGGSSFFLAARLDKDKSFVPVVEAVKAQQDNGIVAGYEMSEMERGVFGFYLRGLLANPINPEQLETFLIENKSQPFSLIVNRRKLDDIKNVLEGKVQLVYEHRPNKRTRSYVVYKNVLEDQK